MHLSSFTWRLEEGDTNGDKLGFFGQEGEKTSSPGILSQVHDTIETWGPAKPNMQSIKRGKHKDMLTKFDRRPQ
jgi:hypothetical protein